MSTHSYFPRRRNHTGYDITRQDYFRIIIPLLRPGIGKIPMDMPDRGGDAVIGNFAIHSKTFGNPQGLMHNGDAAPSIANDKSELNA